MSKIASPLPVGLNTPKPDLFPGTKPAELVQPVHGEPMTTTRRVAAMFGKPHKNVLRSVERLKRDMGDDAFSRLNFEPTTYTDGDGRKQPECLLTKDGFMMLVMGFTGREALHWRKAFIKAFNELARALQREQRARLSADRARVVAEVAKSHSAVMTMLEDTRREQGKTTEAHHYMNEARLIGCAMTGTPAGIDRATLDEDQMRLLHRVENLDIKLLVRGLDYGARKAALCEFVRTETGGAALASLPCAAAQLNFEPSERGDDNGGTH